MKHPSRAVLSSYRDGTLAPDELLAVDDHLAQCAECRRSISDAGVAVRRFAEELGGEHLTYEAMERHVDGRSTPGEQEIVAEHVGFCDACAQELDDLARFHDVPRHNVGRWGFLAAAAAAVVVAIVAFREPRVIEPPASSTAPSAKITPARLPETAVPAARDPFESLDPSLRQVAASLESGTLVSAELLASLRGTPEQQRTADDPKDHLPSLLAPVGTVVEGDRPEFRWSGAATVRVQVFDRDYQLVAESSRLHGTSWQTPSRLPRGAMYRWQLSVQQANGGEMIAPAPPAAAARFRVLGTRAFEALTAARDSGSTLEAGLICMREGLVEEGARLLARNADENPESPIAVRLAEKARAVVRANANP
jgi:anti-sigma factor RsiW